MSRRSIAQAFMEWAPLVAIYESRLWRRSPFFALFLGVSFEREYSLIVEAARLEPTTHVLDLACGPGIYARRFARDARRGLVCGLDLSVPMLRYASRTAHSEGLVNLLLVRGNALDLPFPATEFDLVNCCGALHLFRDPGRVLGEVHRVLRPGGRVTIAAFRRGEGWIAEQRAAMRKQLYGIGAFSASSLAALLAQAGFSGPTCLHSSGVWLMMSARRDGEVAKS
jgi:SAM-dependent methyltransferase